MSLNIERFQQKMLISLEKWRDLSKNTQKSLEIRRDFSNIDWNFLKYGGKVEYYFGPSVKNYGSFSIWKNTHSKNMLNLLMSLLHVYEVVFHPLDLPCLRLHLLIHLLLVLHHGPQFLLQGEHISTRNIFLSKKLSFYMAVIIIYPSLAVIPIRPGYGSGLKSTKYQILKNFFSIKFITLNYALY